MTKFMPTFKNSPWGITLNPVSSNTYKKVLNFPNSLLREEFINNQLFNGENYKQIFSNKPALSFNIHNETTATFTINRSDYQEFTMIELLNRDYGVVQQTDKKTNKTDYLFYQILSSSNNGSSITYLCELDIFFTYNIGFRKNQQINRSHIDRFNDDDKFDFGVNSLFNNPDELDDSYASSALPKEKHELIWNTISDYKSGEDKVELERRLSKMKWTVFFLTEQNLPDDWEGGKFSEEFSLTINGSKIPVVCAVFPNEKIIVWDGDITRSWYADDIYNEWKTLPNDIIIGSTIIDTPPIFKGQFSETFTNWHINTSDLLECNIYEPLETPLNNVVGVDNLKIVALKFTGGNSRICALLRRLNDEVFLESHNIDLSLTPTITNMDENSDRDISKEPKLSCYPYFKVSLTNMSGEKFEAMPNLMNENEYTITHYNNFQPSLQKYSSFVKSGLYGELTELDRTNQIGLISLASYILPGATVAWTEYYATHGASAVAGVVGAGIKGAGITGTIAGTSGKFNPLASFAGAGFSITSQLITRSDIKQTPNSSKNTNNEIISDAIIGTLGVASFKEEMLEIDKQTVADYFYQYGYNIGKILNPNELKESRYYFNFIQLDDTFNNINCSIERDGIFIPVDVGTLTKKIINDSLSQGVQFWHYRDIDTWNDLNNYEKENVEIKYATVKKVDDLVFDNDNNIYEKG